MLAEVLFICDKKACDICRPDCKYTRKITHAAYSPKDLNKADEMKRYFQNTDFKLETVFDSMDHTQDNCTLRLIEIEKFN